MRVVSLLPAATECCAALGVDPVGVSHECDHPPRVRELPTVTESPIDADADGATIDEQVAEAEADGSLYEFDRERLVDLDPDLVLTQGVCSVCAVDEVRAEAVVADLGLDAEVLTVDVHDLADLWETIERLGAALDRPERARSLCEDLQARVDALTERAAAVGARADAGTDAAADAADRPRVAVLDWLDPVMVAGHWVPELVDLAGGRYGLASVGARSRPREWAQIREYDPEVLVAAPCGFGVEQTLATLGDLTERPGWADLRAVEAGNVWVLDGHHYVNRPGPRLVDTLEHLAGVCHPDAFDAPPDEVARRLPEGTDVEP